MKIPPRTHYGFARGLLLLGALGTMGHLIAVSPLPFTHAKEFEFPAQAPPVGDNGPYPSGLPRMKVVPWQRPTEPAPAWLDQNVDKNEIEDSVRSAFDKRLDIDFNAVPLSRVMESIAEKLEIQIHLDDKALEEESITPDEPITWKQSNVKARDAMKQILDPLQLTYKIDVEAVLITSRKISSNVVRAYDLSYVLPDSGLAPEVMGAIESMVQPTEWQIVGGTSEMRMVGSLLLVSAPEETQLSVEHLLRQISKQLPANMQRQEPEAKQVPPTTTNAAKSEDKAQANGVAVANAAGGGVAIGFGGAGVKGAAGVAVGFTGNQPLPAQQKETVQQWEKSKSPTPIWLNEPIEASEIENKIRRSLDERCELNFNGTPLVGVMKFFKGQFAIPIHIDDKSLELESITTDEAITLELPNASFRDSLRLILQPLNLTYVIDREYLLITSTKRQFVSVQNYDLSFILPDSGLVNEIIGTIEAVVSPDHWQIAGGNYTMRSVGSMLVVRADEETHYEIQRLLRSISKQPPANMKSRAMVDKAEKAKPAGAPEPTDAK